MTAETRNASLSLPTLAMLFGSAPWPAVRIVESPPPARAIPSESASFVVTIDGRPYAGFVNRASAESAVRLWSGETDGGGLPVPPHERDRHGWPAARGRLLAVIERSHDRWSLMALELAAGARRVPQSSR